MIDWKDATKEQPGDYVAVLGYTSLGMCATFWFNNGRWEGDLRGTSEDPERVTHWAHLNPPHTQGKENG